MNQIKKDIAIIGAGTIGISLVLDLALQGFNILLIDTNDKQLNSTAKRLEDDLRFVKMIKTEFREVSIESIVSKVKLQTTLDGVENFDFIIENITENFLIKKLLYERLNEICYNNDTIIIANTSCISISKLGDLLKNPAKLVGAHFMNPVPLKKIVEIIKTDKTSEDTLNSCKFLMKSISKKFIVINDSVGFVSNRLSHMFMNEAAFLVYENVSSPKDIDAVFKLGFEHRLGPLETADLIGIDTVVNSLEVLYEEYHNSKFECCPLLKRMVDENRLGRKTGKGFYIY